MQKLTSSFMQDDVDLFSTSMYISELSVDDFDNTVSFF